MLVGDSSKARKGSSWKQVAKLLGAVDETWVKQRVMSGLSSGEGLIWAVRDPIVQPEGPRDARKKPGDEMANKTVVVDAGIADKRLLVIEGEFSSVLRMLGRQGSTLSAILRHAWDDGSLRILTKNSPAVATEAHISMVGHITREELLRYLGDTEQGNGFANRFLWVAVKRSKTLPEGGAMESIDLGDMKRRMGATADNATNRGRLRFDDEARSMWHAVYPKLSAGKPGLLGAVTARGEAHTARLALTYALLDRASEIRREHLLAALAVWDYCERSAVWVFGKATGNPLADHIMDALPTNGFSRTQIRDLFSRNKPACKIDQAIAELEMARMVRTETVGGTGGRNAERILPIDTTETTNTTFG